MHVFKHKSIGSILVTPLTHSPYRLFTLFHHSHSSCRHYSHFVTETCSSSMAITPISWISLLPFCDSRRVLCHYPHVVVRTLNLATTPISRPIITCSSSTLHIGRMQLHYKYKIFIQHSSLCKLDPSHPPHSVVISRVSCGKLTHAFRSLSSTLFI